MKKYLISITILLVSFSKSYAQGCSDAGVCTMASTHFTDSLVSKNSLELGYIYGKGLGDVAYNNGYISYTRSFSEKWSLNAKVTYNQANGNFGTLGQFGDLFLIVNNFKKLITDNTLKTTFGLKIPFSSANLKVNGIALPMDYQASLGTFDALLGFDYGYKKWNFDAALQLPVWQINRNSYFDEYSTSNNFPTTNLFRRKPDILVRLMHTFNTKNKKWFLKPNIMTIYHLSNDTYEDVFGKRQIIDNSQGLTINASLITIYNFNKKNSLHLNIAAPLLVRDIRPDGLTRAFVGSISYQFKF